ncbi:MAG: hypothetical protein HUU21_22745, partial [Polyangiaceae bacterium]|nr:hypothetical protein [Polyangiaceae bacterium]
PATSTAAAGIGTVTTTTSRAAHAIRRRGVVRPGLIIAPSPSDMKRASPARIARHGRACGVDHDQLATRLDADDRSGRRLGVFWHTQGSGRSFSMVIFSQKIFRRFPAYFPPAPGVHGSLSARLIRLRHDGWKCAPAPASINVKKSVRMAYRVLQ